MDSAFDIGFFIVGSLIFFVIPFVIIITIINFLVTRRMAKKGITKSKMYWPKLVGYSVLVLIAGLFLYDGYYKLVT